MSNGIHISPRLRCFGMAGFVILLSLAACGKKVNISSPHSVTLSWAPSKSSVAGYNVYRVAPSGQVVRLTNRMITETQFTDRTVQGGQTYSYYVTSVDASGRESQPSEKIIATVPATPTPPAKQ